MSNSQNILITGGAGFIGSHVADELLKHGYRVRAFDILSPQVHGTAADRPDYLHAEVEIIRADLRNAAAVDQALCGIDAVFHFAAAVGVGQSMYEIENYMNTNAVGTAVLLEALIKNRVEKLIVASSAQAFNIGGGPERAINLLQLIDLIAELHGERPHYEFQEWRPGDQKYYVSDTSKFKNAVGWSPKVDVESGLRKLYDWLRSARAVEPSRAEPARQKSAAAFRKAGRNGFASDERAYVYDDGRK